MTRVRKPANDAHEPVNPRASCSSRRREPDPAAPFPLPLSEAIRFVRVTKAAHGPGASLHRVSAPCLSNAVLPQPAGPRSGLARGQYLMRHV